MQCHKIRPVNSWCSDLKHLLGFSVLEKNNVTVKRAMLIFLPELCISGSRKRAVKVSLVLFCHVNLGKALSLLQGEEQEQDAARMGCQENP